jgi:hypothetical protein
MIYHSDMNSTRFHKLVEQILNQTRAVLIAKGDEYSTEENKLHNFDKAARISGQTREKALWGMALKHYTSIDDIVNDVETGKLPSEAMLSEKIGDMINYLILLEASIINRLEE